MTITLELLTEINSFTINASKEYSAIESRSITNIHRFINDKKVQKSIKEDYDNKKYHLFDTSFGDNGCQSRPLNLLPIIATNQLYDDLSERDKLYLSLCHILRTYKIFKFDDFGMALFDKIQASQIGYGPPNNRKKLKNAEDDSIVMGHLLANMSVQGVRERAKTREMLDQVSTNQTRNAPDKKSLFRKEPTSGELELLLIYMVENNIPLMLKVTRINASGKFTLQGADIVMYVPDNGNFRPANADELLKLSKLPAVLAECFSIVSNIKQNKMLPIQEILDQTNSFEEYLEALKTLDIRDLMMPLAYESDLALGMIDQPREYKEEVDVLSKQKLDYVYTKAISTRGGKTIHSEYINRNSVSIPFNIAHFYVSSLEQEQELLNIINRDAVLEEEVFCSFTNENGRSL